MIYQKEIEKAINWLFETQDRESFGWSWVQNISPNEQNTAEVVYAVSLFSNILSSSQKQLINEAVRKWLLLPEKHAVLTIDWAWVGLALSKYADHFTAYSPDFDIEFVHKDIETCVESILSLQNPDGGWGDYRHDMSTAFRTSISIIFLENQSQVKTPQLEKALDRAAKWASPAAKRGRRIRQCSALESNKKYPCVLRWRRTGNRRRSIPVVSLRYGIRSVGAVLSEQVYVRKRNPSSRQLFKKPRLILRLRDFF